jgi:hypothetical protein
MLSVNPAAIHLLKQNPDKIDWKWLCKNPEATEILKANQGKIDWGIFSYNTGIFEYDYPNMSRPFTEELFSVVYHPDNRKRLL